MENEKLSFVDVASTGELDDILGTESAAIMGARIVAVRYVGKAPGGKTATYSVVRIYDAAFRKGHKEISISAIKSLVSSGVDLGALNKAAQINPTKMSLGVEYKLA